MYRLLIICRAISRDILKGPRLFWPLIFPERSALDSSGFKIAHVSNESNDTVTSKKFLLELSQKTNIFIDQIQDQDTDSKDVPVIHINK